MSARRLEKLPLHPCLVLMRAVSPEGELLKPSGSSLRVFRKPQSRGVSKPQGRAAPLPPFFTSGWAPRFEERTSGKFAARSEHVGASLPGTVYLVGRLRVSIQRRRLPWGAPARGSQQPRPPPRCSRQPALGSDCGGRGSGGAEQAAPRQRGPGGGGGGQGGPPELRSRKRVVLGLQPSGPARRPEVQHPRQRL